MVLVVPCQGNTGNLAEGEGKIGKNARENRRLFALILRFFAYPMRGGHEVIMTEWVLIVLWITYQAT